MSDQRDHLINDATGLPQRFELQVDEQWWVVGARDNGAISVFAGDDFVVQFNPVGELRRLFADGVRFKAVEGRMVRATRTAARGSMRLESSELSSQDADALQLRLVSALQRLRDALAHGANSGARIGRAIGPDPQGFVAQVERWVLQQCEAGVTIAAEPHAS